MVLVIFPQFAPALLPSNLHSVVAALAHVVGIEREDATLLGGRWGEAIAVL